MPFIDVSTLLQPIDEGEPCGPNLEYSAAYLEAARALAGCPDVQYGSLRIAAIEPDWPAVKRATLALLERSHDLRLAVWLTRALVVMHGAAAAADGCTLIEGLLARYWSSVHPQLDVDDDCDPTARLNTLLDLDDKAGFVLELSRAPLVASPRHASVCLLDVEWADGEVAASDATRSVADIDAAFADAALDDLAEMGGALERALASIRRIDALLTERLGHGRAIALRALEHTLARASEVVKAQLARHPAAVAPHDGALDSAASTRGCAPAAITRIEGRDDVLRLLDRLCAYYAHAEPSSPVPVLLRRARKLVGVRFADAVCELAPAGTEQVRHWIGLDPE